MKKNDIVSWKVLDKTYRGRVNWIKDENAGITLMGDKYSGVEATVQLVKDCTVVIEYKGDALKEKIHDMSTEKLIASIQRLKGMRLPKSAKRRAASSRGPSKRQRMTKLLEVLDGDPDALDALIDKALEEGKEEKKG